MILIFEGLDKSGKTSIIEKIPGIKIKNYYLPRDDTLEEREKIRGVHQMILTMITGMQRSNYNIILDRSPISEIVYSKVRRGYEAIDNPQWMDMVRKLKSLGAIVFYCTADNGDLWERCLKHEDPEAKMEEMDELKERYLDILNSSGISYIELNTSEKTIEECVVDIEAVLEEQPKYLTVFRGFERK